jgi:23S rRNA (guanosine2251-2'-O)-methyltransferase
MSKETDFFFGVNPVREKLNSAPSEIAEIVLSDKPLRPVLREIEARARQRGVTISYLPAATLDRLAQGQNHQGVLARLHAYFYLPFSELLQDLSASDGERILAVDGVTDPRNLGALLRTAEAVGVRYIILPKDRSAAVSPTVVKASAGAVHHLKVCRVTNLRRAMTDLKHQGFWTVGLDPAAADSIYDQSFPQKLAIVLGSEGSGIRPLVLKECDFRVSIPMQGKVGSLNVAVAGGVFLYEIFRQSRGVDMGRPKRY